MAKKVMIVCGSPRENGNTMTLAGWVAAGARGAGAEVEIVDAAKLKYKVHGCIACMGCQKTGEYRCVIDDEAAPVLARIPEQDVLVFATPVYFMGFSAQIKLLIDRMFSLVKIKGDDYTLAPGFAEIDYALIASGGGREEDGLNLVEENMKAIADFAKKSSRSLLVPFAPLEPGAIASNEELREKAMAFGAELAG